MFKNVASQKIEVFAFDYTTGAPKTGDSANITVYVSKDGGAVTALTDTSATEMSSTNAPGWYQFDVSQTESNADMLLFTGKSSTANVSVVGVRILTRPNRFTTTVIDSAGLVDANVVKLGPTGSGTAQTARDIGASVLLSVGTGTGQVNLSSGAVPVKGNIKKNTALAAFPFMMTDSTNHAPATGKTVTVTRSIDGGAFGAGTLSAVTEVGVGIYTVDFGAGDLNGNSIILRATATACDDTFERITTQVA